MGYDVEITDTKLISLLDDDRFKDDPEPRAWTESDAKAAQTFIKLGMQTATRRLYWHRDDCDCGMCVRDRSK